MDGALLAIAMLAVKIQSSNIDYMLIKNLTDEIRLVAVASY